ncbi:MAG: stage II sporulation protein M [Tenericutes bacterium]|nr:stage II sporulation protein M [Mycoplasmatota bacterium]
MRRLIFLLKNYYRVNKKYFVFITIIFFIAIMSGSIFTLTLNDTDTNIVSEFFSNYLENINKINYINSFVNSLISNIFVVMIIWLLSYSIIGLPIIILIFFYKSFIIGFSISGIIINYKIKGLLMAFLYIFPHQILFILALLYLLVFSVIMSINLFYAVFKHENIRFSSNNNLIIIFTSIITLLCSIYDSFMLPLIMKFMI